MILVTMMMMVVVGVVVLIEGYDAQLLTIPVVV